MLDIFHDLLFDYTLRNVALGAALLGIVGGVLGCFAVLRRQALLGDALSHTALPGIVLAFILTGSKSSIVLMIGAAVAGWIGTLLIIGLVRETRLSQDTALGTILTVFFGAGVVGLSYVQQTRGAEQAGLDKFLFGQAATLVQRSVIEMAIVGLPALLIVAIFYKEFKLFSFDAEFAGSLGFPVQTLNVVLTTLIVAAVAIGLQTVGVVLMAAMLIGPAAAARQWTNRLGVMLMLAGLFGALAGVSGAVISVSAERISTGPMIVLCMTAIAVVSLLFAPNRGIVWEAIRLRRARRHETLRLALESGGDE